MILLKKIKPIFALSCVMFLTKSYCQYTYTTTKWENYIPKTVFVSYDYMNRNTIKTGIEFFIPNKSSNPIFIGLGYGIGIDNAKIFSFANAHLSLNLQNGYVLKLATTTTSLTSSAGVSLFNALDFNLGYSFPFQNQQIHKLKGITVGITVRISNHNKVYLPMKLF